MRGRRFSQLLVALAFTLGALLSVWFVLPGRHGDSFRSAASEDTLARRRSLVRRMMAEPVHPDDIATVPDLFKGEWAFGTYAMAGYALMNIAIDAPQTKQESVEVLQHIIAEMQTPRIYSFDAVQWASSPLALAPGGGGDRGHIAYLGHLNLLIGAYRLLGGDDRYNTLHTEITDAIVRRMHTYPHRHVETYPGETYTMDNLVAVASLAAADRVAETDHSVLIGEYLDYTRQHLRDPNTGLIVFGVDERTGAPLQRGRGCAAGWASFFLPFLDKPFAREQFDALRAHLAGRIGPFAGVREYAIDDPNAGFGDIDSGPVLGWGVSATGFSIAGARIHNDARMYQGLLGLAEVVGVTVECRGERRYLSAPLLGDAILLAMKTARPWWDGMGERP